MSGTTSTTPARRSSSRAGEASSSRTMSTGPGAACRYANNGSLSGMSTLTPGCSGWATTGAAAPTPDAAGSVRPRSRRKGRVSAVMRSLSWGVVRGSLRNTRRHDAGPRACASAAAEPHADAGRPEGAADGVDQLVLHRGQRDLVAEPLGELARRPLGVVARAIEPTVHHPLDALAGGLEQGEREQRGSRDSEGGALRDTVKERLQCHDADREYAEQQSGQHAP